MKYAEVENVLCDTFDTAIADESFVRNALTPFSERQRQCVWWLEDYFKIYADCDPDSDQKAVQVMQNKTLYMQYRKEVEQLGDGEFVDESTFDELWRVLFPKYQKRNYCDIPGSCNVCYKIDRARRQESDRHTGKMWSEVHALHRGGMFMAERKSYMNRRQSVKSFDICFFPSLGFKRIS